MPSTRETGCGSCLSVYNPSTWEMAAGELEIQDHPPLYSEFQAKLGYIRLCVKREKKEVEKEEEGDIGGQAWWVIFVIPALGGRGPKIKSSGVQG